VLTGQNISIAQAPVPLLKALSFHLNPGDWCWTGAPTTAVGKTSVLRLLGGLLWPGEGSLWWKGVPINPLSEDYRSQVAYLSAATLGGVGVNGGALSRTYSTFQPLLRGRVLKSVGTFSYTHFQKVNINGSSS
jgi:ABC-type transporter Mla maintaining outer membrane lipid asymmetry ATPase subunit MlaF